MWQENSYDYYFFSWVYLGLELGIHMRECSNYLLGILELPLLTNLHYFSRERNSCVILPLTVQGDVWFLLLKTEVKPIWGVTLPQSEFKHFFSHSPFSLLFFYLLPHSPSPAHTLSPLLRVFFRLGNLSGAQSKLFPRHLQPPPHSPWGSGHKTAPSP